MQACRSGIIWKTGVPRQRVVSLLEPVHRLITLPILTMTVYVFATARCQTMYGPTWLVSPHRARTVSLRQIQSAMSVDCADDRVFVTDKENAD